MDHYSKVFQFWKMLHLNACKNMLCIVSARRNTSHLSGNQYYKVFCCFRGMIPGFRWVSVFGVCFGKEPDLLSLQRFKSKQSRGQARYRCSCQL